MNFMQSGLFIVFVFSVLASGITLYNILDKSRNSFLNKSLYLGEVLLIGSIFLIGEMLIFSLIGLYRPIFLWTIVMSNCAFFLKKTTRKDFSLFLLRKVDLDPAKIVFLILVSFFIFRNFYFLIDVDSISTYLFIQKLWLSAGTSICGNITNDLRIFNPHFDALPYSLGISVFGQETLFPQLINLFWRLIVLMLIFGYASYRLNTYCGLAASMFVLFDSHFFYSGVNHWVVINGALIALLFASAYNFWQARTEENPFRFLLAIIFLSQLLANKLQMAYVFLFMLPFGIFLQHKPLKRIQEVCGEKKRIVAILVAVLIMSFWFIKNIFVIGAIFPVFADKPGIFNFNPSMTDAFIKVFGGIKFDKFIKYMNYLFIWPGITVAKWIVIVISFLPIILTAFFIRNKANKELILELCFWLSSSILVIMGVCLFCHQDPRYYRYPLAILSFSAVFCIYCILRYCLNIQKEIFLTGIIVLFALQGFSIVYQTGGSSKRPDFKENAAVFLNKIHVNHAIEKHFPYVPFILDELKLSENQEKLKNSAWDSTNNINFPAFLLPIRPMVSLWFSTVIKWDSYENENLIINDLKQYGIEWLIRIKDNGLIFLPIKDYAREAINYERYPKKVFYDYGFPQELSNITHKQH